MSNTNIVKYELDSGAEITLSPEMVKSYLVNGNGKVTDQEIFMFIKLCEHQKINPFLREAYLIKYGDTQPATIVTGKELFTKRAENHPDFDGYEAGVIVHNAQDNKIQNRMGTTYLPKFGETLIGGWAKVYRKNCKTAFEMTAMFDEYVGRKKDGAISSMWAGKPATMIRKVALVQALREAFPDMYGGLYSQEEINTVHEKDLPENEVVLLNSEQLPAQEQKSIVDYAKTKFPERFEKNPAENTGIYITTAQARLLFANASNDIVKKVITEFGYESTKHILKKDFDGILKRLADEKLAREQTVTETTAVPADESDDDFPYDGRLPWETGDGMSEEIPA